MSFDYNNKQIDRLLTAHQLNVLNAYREQGSQQAAADHLNTSRENISSAMLKIRRKANQALAGLHDSSVHNAIPEGYLIKGVSNMVENSLGKPMWVKTDIDASERLKAMENAIDALLHPGLIRPEIKQPTHDMSTDLLNQYTFTDFHIGMLCWHKEGGDNWNISIAKSTLKHCFADMIARAPKSETCVINQLGDFFHFDSMTPETPTSGHILDADSRPEKMIEAAIECMDYLIVTALENHAKVKVVIAQGNHDLYSSLMLRKQFAYMYRENERIEFVESSIPFYALEWGIQMLGYYHGHKVKFDKLPSVFMDQYREMYGRTTKTTIHTAHFHHQKIEEFGTTTVEMHRTLAARDAHTSYSGYTSDRASDVITYHKNHGEIARSTVRPLLFGDC